MQGTSQNSSVTFARSTSDHHFQSVSDASRGAKVEKEKKKSGGGGLALAMVYAAKLGCYFIVQVRARAALTHAIWHRYMAPIRGQLALIHAESAVTRALIAMSLNLYHLGAEN